MSVDPSWGDARAATPAVALLFAVAAAALTVAGIAALGASVIGIAGLAAIVQSPLFPVLAIGVATAVIFRVCQTLGLVLGPALSSAGSFAQRMFDSYMEDPFKNTARVAGIIVGGVFAGVMAECCLPGSGVSVGGAVGGALYGVISNSREHTFGDRPINMLGGLLFGGILGGAAGATFGYLAPNALGALSTIMPTL